MDKRILVVETGGTFATSAVGNVRTLEHYGIEKTVFEYDSILERKDKYTVEFDIIRPIFTLSENMTLELINKLLEALYKVDFSRYIGVIITHGTDTLAYTSNILSLLFSHKGIPVVMVSSNHPLSDLRANGVENFACAMDFICTVKVQGVFVMYRDFEGVTEVHLGSRVKQMNQIIDSYESFKNIDFGKMIDDVFVYNENPLNPSIEKINACTDRKPVQSLSLKNTVMMIYPYVGLRHDLYNINEELDAVVYGVYHSGTFCSHAGHADHSINKLVERLKNFDIPLYISEVSSQSIPYDSTTYLEKNANVNIAFDISLENLYSKVIVAVSLFDNIDERNNYIKDTDVFFERVV